MNIVLFQRKEKALEIQELSQGERKVEETIKPNEEQLDVLERQLAKETEEDLFAQRQIRDSLNRLSNAVENSRKLEQQVPHFFVYFRSIMLSNHHRLVHFLRENLKNNCFPISNLSPFAVIEQQWFQQW